MLKRGSHAYSLFFRKKREVTTWALPLDPPSASPSSTLNDHKTLCLSLIDQLIQKGRFSLAQSMIQRIISQSPSVPDAFFTIDYASKQGMELDVTDYVVLIGKLVQCGKSPFAEALYYKGFCGRGTSPDDINLLNSMVTCFCELGKMEEAMSHFDRLIQLGSIPCEAACNLFLQELLAKGMVLEAFNYLSDITCSGFHMEVQYYNMLIDRLCCKGHFDESFEVIGMMQDAGISPTLHQFKSIFYGLCKRSSPVKAELVSLEMENLGFFVDKVMYTSLICGYGRENKMKIATRVFFRMLKMGCEPDTFTFNTLINGFLKLGLSGKGLWMYNKMRDSGNHPNAFTYHIEISRFCKEGKLMEALRVYDEMVKKNLVPPVHSYTALISMLYKEDNLVEADKLWKRMLDQGVLPDHILYFIIMRKKEDKLEFAFKILCAINGNEGHCEPHYPRDMEILLDEIAKKSPHLAKIAFGICICAFCETGHLHEAKHFMNKMDASGYQPMLFTYNCFIKCLCQYGFFEDAKFLICLMQDKGLVPNDQTFLIMVNEYCKQGWLDSAKYFVNQMVEMGVKPNVALYDTLINFLGMRKRVDEAEDLFKELLLLGDDLDEVVFTTMINVYLKSWRLQEAIELFDEMKSYYPINPSLYSYTALISGLVKKDRIKKGCYYLEEMLRKGFELNKVLYTSLIGQLLKNGVFGVANYLVNLMEGSQIERDPVTYIVLNSSVSKHLNAQGKGVFLKPRSAKDIKMLLSLLEHRNYASRESLFRSYYSPKRVKFIFKELMSETEKDIFMPNLYVYNCWIAGFCRAKEMEKANDYLKEMQTKGLRPNQVTYTILMSGYIQDGKLCRAVDLFNKMNFDGCCADQVAYNTLLKGLCLSQRLLEAVSLSYMMQKKGLFPSKSSYTILLKLFCKFDMAASFAFNIYEEMISREYKIDRYCCGLLYRRLCGDKMTHEAKAVYDFALCRDLDIPR